MKVILYVLFCLYCQNCLSQPISEREFVAGKDQKKFTNSFFKEKSAIVDSLDKYFKIKSSNDALYYSPVMVNAQKAGVYQFFLHSTHSSTANFFLFDGILFKKMSNSSLGDYSEILKSLGFKKKKIQQVILRMQKVVNVNNSQINFF